MYESEPGLQRHLPRCHREPCWLISSPTAPPCGRAAAGEPQLPLLTNQTRLLGATEQRTLRDTFIRKVEPSKKKKKKRVCLRTV